MPLKQQTIDLIQECNDSITRFHAMREKNIAPLFFDEVKPHADKMAQLLNDWQMNADEWICVHSPKYIHLQQILSVVEAMNQFVVQSFYKETSKKRFIQSVHSTLYTLNIFLRYLQEDDYTVCEEIDGRGVDH